MYLIFTSVRRKSHLFPFISILGLLILFSCSTVQVGKTSKTFTLDEVLNSKQDLWGEAAMTQPNGASYEFFAPLLPPPRYVNADFHYYPIVLSSPKSNVKARLISNGSGININGGVRSWRDVGIPVTFRVGPDEFLFGSLPNRLSEPVLVDGWLPIPQICYSHRTPIQSEGEVPLNQKKQESIAEMYRLEAFASTDSSLAKKGVVFVKFDLKEGNDGYIAVDIKTTNAPKFENHKLIDLEGKVLAIFDENWKLDGKLIKARLQKGNAATLAIPTEPLDQSTKFELDASTYALQRERCILTWKNLLAPAMQIETPEPLVNNVYKNSLCQIFQLINGDKTNYSAGNQYEKLYEAEGSDAIQALLSSGFEKETRLLMIPLFDFTRKGLELHHASFKIGNLCQYYWQTRDQLVVNELRPKWEKEIQLLDVNRTGANGLYPPEQYCGDIHTFVQSLNVNANAWRAMRDMGAVLSETGDLKEASHLSKEAAIFRQVVLNAVNNSISTKTEPPFVPIALNGEEPVHDPILHSRIGSYWNIIIGYTIRSGIFPPGSKEANWIPRYQEQHGGIFMGMVKSGGGNFNFWIGDQRVNPLYGTRYALDALRRDDPERALVSFYGTLAQGITRNTFVGGEGSSLQPVDDKGRIFYCPPNSAASAHVISMLRNLLVQDWDLDDDGIPETLRLAFATPRHWLEDGKTIKVEKAPTAFGPISYILSSNLEAGEITLTYSPPVRSPQKTLARIRVPDKWKIESAHIGNQNIKIDESGTFEIVSGTSPMVVHISVKRLNFQPIESEEHKTIEQSINQQDKIKNRIPNKDNEFFE